MILSALLALASPRSEGLAAEQSGAYADALAAYRRCVAEGPDLDRRYCAARVGVLEPQAADGFAGWAALEAVRRSYRELGPEAARARVEAALAADPDGPAAAAMRAWIANEQLRVEDFDRARATLAGDPAAAARVGALVEARARRAADRDRHRALGWAGATVGLAALGAALARRGPVGWGWGLGVGALLGALPAAIAAAYGEGGATGLLAAGGWLGIWAALAGRAGPWLAVPGAAGGLVYAWERQGWLAGMGL